MNTDERFATATMVVESLQQRLDMKGLQEVANRLRYLEVVDENSARIALRIIDQMPLFEDDQLRKGRDIALQTLRYVLRPRVAAPVAA